jgi:pimeloyl-ACP methyl ester carboxylesterase
MKTQTESRIANTACGAIEYTLLGKGPVVLVLHGTSSNCFSVDGSAPLLEAGFAVLTPSRPGYGHTPLNVGASAEQAADAMAALLDSLQIETCVVKAVSGGGPTGIALAARRPERVSRLVLAAAITKPEGRINEPAYRSQKSFYGPLHSMTWNMLGLISRRSPTGMARQTMAIFSTHDPDEALKQLTPQDIESICRFYQGHSSRRGALNDLAHTVGSELLQTVQAQTLVIHSREDKSVPFDHAKWALAHIPHAELCESGATGHFYWVGPDYPKISQKLVSFLRTA